MTTECSLLKGKKGRKGEKRGEKERESIQDKSIPSEGCIHSEKPKWGESYVPDDEARSYSIQMEWMKRGTMSAMLSQLLTSSPATFGGSPGMQPPSNVRMEIVSSKLTSMTLQPSSLPLELVSSEVSSHHSS